METSNKSNGAPLNDLTLFAEDTLASPLAPQENDAEPMTPATFGLGLETPLAHYDPDTRFWKTSEAISLWGEQPSLETLPKSGMTQNGVLYQQPDWVRPIDVNESLLWPTPTTQENEHPNAIWNEKWRRVAPSGVTHGMNLADAVQMWPTPVANDAKNPYARVREFSQSTMLGEALVKADPSTAGGKLNPMWVEWLMGFPLGWTDLED
jgi:hypothetical protein